MDNNDEDDVVMFKVQGNQYVPQSFMNVDSPHDKENSPMRGKVR